MPEISGDPSRTTIRSDISVLRWLACLTIEIGPKRAFPAFAHPKQSFSAIVQLALSLDVLTDVSGTVERDEEEEKTLDQIIDRLIRSAIRALRQAVGSTQIDPPVSSLVRIYAGGARL